MLAPTLNQSAHLDMAQAVCWSPSIGCTVPSASVSPFRKLVASWLLIFMGFLFKVWHGVLLSYICACLWSRDWVWAEHWVPSI
jgi:hypothetical protein